MKNATVGPRAGSVLMDTFEIPSDNWGNTIGHGMHPWISVPLGSGSTSCLNWQRERVDLNAIKLIRNFLRQQRLAENVAPTPNFADPLHGHDMTTFPGQPELAHGPAGAAFHVPPSGAPPDFTGVVVSVPLNGSRTGVAIAIR
jgi:hypothetical protein